MTAPACGGDDGDDTPDAGGADAAADAPVQSTALDPICNETDGLFVDLFGKFFGCNSFFEVLIGEVSAADLSAACYANFQPFIDDGTIEVGTSAALQACRDYITNTDCQLFDIDNSCDGAFVGNVANGGDCDSSEQCGSNSYCDTTGTGCGECSPTLANGVACSEGDDCTSGHCGSAGLCADKGNIGDACVGDDDCIGQLVCDDGNTDLCVALPEFAVGDTCDNQDFASCGFPLSGFFCDGTNSECAAESDVGMTCDNVDTRCHTIEFEWCDNGTCAAPGIVGEGQTCGIGFDTQANKCAAGLRCSDPFGPGTCVEPQQVGQSCVDTDGEDIDNECDFLLNCVNGTCQESEHTGMCPAP